MPEAMSAQTMVLEYREIRDHPGFRIGNDGSVWSQWRWSGVGSNYKRWRIDNWCLVEGHKDKDGHIFIWLFDTNHFVHRLMLETFIGPCPEGMEGCHNDGVPWHNWLSNLRWDYHKNNYKDSVTHGTSSKGTRHGRAIFTMEDILSIRHSRKNGQTVQQICEQYNCHIVTIQRILKGETYSDVT